MTRNQKTAMALTAIGLCVSMAPGPRLSEGQDDYPAAADPPAGATAQVTATVIHIEAEALDELRGSVKSSSLTALPLGRIWEMARSEDGVQIVSRSSLSALHGHKASMRFTESETHKNKNNAAQSHEFAAREVLVNFEVIPEIDRQKGIAVQFNYKREESEEVQFETEDNEEEAVMDRLIELSNTLILLPGQERIAGAKQNEDITIILVLMAE